MTIPELVAQLVEVLEELALQHKAWASRANRHRMDLVARRMQAVAEGAAELDAEIERMTPLEDRRIELSCALGTALGMRVGERPPTIAELRDALGAERAEPIVAAARVLKLALAESSALAERNRRIAEAGRRATEAAVKALTRIVVRSRSTQAAYDRAGARSNAMAVPFSRHAWNG